MSYANCYIKKKSIKVQVKLEGDLIRLPEDNFCELDVTQAPRYEVLPVGAGKRCMKCDYQRVE